MLFDSVRQAALIITVLPLAAIGGVFGLLATGEYLSVPAAVGFINLWGIAVLNGVVLISQIRALLDQGHPLAEAIREGCVHRFRPVMMTATVAMLALIPMALSDGPGSEVTRPLAVVVIGGADHVDQPDAAGAAGALFDARPVAGIAQAPADRVPGARGGRAKRAAASHGD